MRFTIRNDETDRDLASHDCVLKPGEEQAVEIQGKESVYLALTVPNGRLTTMYATPPDAPADHIEQFFTFEHLPVHLREVSRPFCELAKRIVENLPRNPERTVALRKLLEAKDAAVRALVAKG